MGILSDSAAAIGLNKAALVAGLLLCLASALRGRDAREVYKTAAPAVVSLQALDANGEALWSGTGFFVSADGRLMTNYHVIDHAPRLRIRFQDHTEQFVTLLIATDKGKDLAILKVDVDQVPFLQLACGHRPEIGSTVYTIGNTLGVLDNTFSQGIISGVRKVGDRTLLQTSAPISHGNSGGPLLNEGAQVVGITTSTIGDGQNLNFAVAADDICRLVSDSGSPKPLSGLVDDAPSAKVQPPAGKGTSAKLGSTIDPRWLSSNVQTVLADQHFYDLDVEQREAVLSEIDQHFRNLSPGKRQAFLWAAETNNLPKPPESTQIYTWTAGCSNCKAELSGNSVTKVFESDRIQIKASFPSSSFASRAFLESYIRIVNNSESSIEVIPQTFSVRVLRPKPYLLRFEYPYRVAGETLTKTIEGEVKLNITVPPELNRMIAALPAESLRDEVLQPGDVVEGKVFFENPEKKPRDFVLNLFFGHDSYQFPFSAPQ